MTKQPRENPDELESLVGITADADGTSRAYIEKAFGVTEVLRSASTARAITLPNGTTTRSVTLAFKGGTGLSRVLGIIERFSEEVDLLAMFPADATLNARHKILKAVDADVKKHLDLKEHQVNINSSTGGIKRYTTCLYPTRSHEPSFKDVCDQLGQSHRKIQPVQRLASGQKSAKNPATSPHEILRVVR